jgi:hypothetical protein
LGRAPSQGYMAGRQDLLAMIGSVIEKKAWKKKPWYSKTAWLQQAGNLLKEKKIILKRFKCQSLWTEQVSKLNPCRYLPTCRVH